MTKRRGRMWMKTRLTQGAITWVCGDRKWMLSTTTVTHMLQYGTLNHYVGLRKPKLDVEQHHSHTYSAIQDIVFSHGSEETGNGC
jgi:hypothetical protein